MLTGILAFDGVFMKMADDGTAWQLLAAAWRERGQPLHALRAEEQAQLAWQDLAGVEIAARTSFAMLSTFCFDS